jgi:hypothetical protein
MKLQVRSVAAATALVFSALSLTLIFAPHLIVGDWGLDVTLSVEVVCRRVGALFGGVAVMFFFAREAEPSVARTALIKGVVAICALLTALGLFELSSGNVTPRILIPVAIEVVMMLAFLVAGRSHPGPPYHRYN